MFKRELTTMTIKHEPTPVRTELWNLMPIGTTFIHDDGHLCIKINDEFLFDFEEKDAFSVETNPSLIFDAHDDPMEFELVDISITVRAK